MSKIAVCDNAVAQGAGLAGHAAAGNGGYDVHLTGVAGGPGWAASRRPPTAS